MRNVKVDAAALVAAFSINKDCKSLAKQFSLHPTTVRNHLRSILPPEEYSKYKKYRVWPWHEIQVYYDAGHTSKECQTKWNISDGSWDHACKRSKAMILRSRDVYKLDEVLVKDSHCNASNLKRRLLKSGLVGNYCHMPGCIVKDTWLGKPLILQMHHINGISNDNRLENLLFICANCHTQTDNFTSKNWKNPDRIKRC